MNTHRLIIGVVISFTINSTEVVAASCNKDAATVLAMNMYHEARGDGDNLEDRNAAMQMVGEVTLNRVRSKRYPNTVCDVVYQKNQFSWTTQDDITPKEKESWEHAVELSKSMLAGTADYFDNGATHFINLEKVDNVPKWVGRLKYVGKVGEHVFYTDGSVPSLLKVQFTNAI